MRSKEFQHLIDAAEAAISHSSAASADARRAAGAAFGRIRERQLAAADLTPATLPVCDHLDTALLAATGARAAVAATFAALSPRLAWRRRASADPANTAYYHGHANAMLLGPGGLEDRDDVWFGATLMAPGVVYPEHDHPPEEVYLPLTSGLWWNAAMEWTDPGRTA